MLEDERTKCHVIIHMASLATAGIGGGLAQIPTSDNIAIIPIQVAMIIALGSVFNITIDESTAKATLATTTATITGRSISQVLVGWIPAIGNVFNAITAGALTESIGWTIANDFNTRSKLRTPLNGKIKERL
ncbi:hypothetical protein CIW83_18155 [Tissierella sp. P1]|nr:hypothetical protein CIW83_18155 [Tissierella sp. P1]